MEALPVFSVSPLTGLADERLRIAKSIAEQIAVSVPPVYQGYDRSGVWTTAIRNVLRRLMPEAWTMYPPRDDSSSGEFLVDACWLAGRQGVALAAEFEWGDRSAILFDFDKIAVIKAPLKLIIYCSPHGETSSLEIEAAMIDYLEAYEHHLEGETYMFIDYLPHEHVRCLVWQATTSGLHKNVTLTQTFGPHNFVRKWKPED